MHIIFFAIDFIFVYYHNVSMNHNYLNDSKYTFY